MRCAAIDLGTNSCRLLIAEKTGNDMRCLGRGLETTRLGQNISSTGKLSVTGMDRTVKCMDSFVLQMKQMGVEKYRAVATSAVREAENGQELIQMLLKKCGIQAEVINGEEEAFLSYQGVKRGLDLDGLPLVADLGGGSTEIMLEGNFRLSFPVGAVKATENNMSPFDIAEILCPLKQYIRMLSKHPLVMVGGTAATIAAVKLKLEIYRSDLVHGHVLKRREIADICTRLGLMSLEERKRVPGLQPARADIITGGALVMLSILDLLGKTEMIVSESDLLEGIIWEL